MKLSLLVLIATSSVFSSNQPSRPLRRYLVAAASNDGGPGKIPLRFAGDDARGVVATMSSVGGVASDEVELLLEPDTGRFLSTMREVSRRMALSRDSGYRVEFILYYSGHSDEEGLLLGSTRLRYQDLRKVLDKSPADVRLAVLDACASGAALRAKGGIRRQAFQVEGADRLRGQAYLTSSRAEEASQESDKLGGSVFTNAFLAGVRGAADADADGRVTLLEAYRYAYRETVEKTSSTRVGPQHPEFDLDLSGSGDVVLSDIAQAGAVLELGGDLRGRIRVADSTGAVAAELDAVAGRSLPIGLPAGTWRVTMTDSVGSRIGTVELPPGSRILVGIAGLDSVVPDRDTTRKSDAVQVAHPSAKKTDSVKSVHVPLDLGLAPPATINNLFPGSRIKNNFAIDLFAGEATEIEGFQVTVGLARATEVRGFQVAGIAAMSSARVEGFQSAGLWTSLEEGLRGFQTAGLVAQSKGPFDGFQAAGLASWNQGRLRGVQAGGLFVYDSSETQGVQAAGLASWNEGAMQGLQAAGVFTYAGSNRGLQVSVVNISGSVTGAQVGVVNVAGRVRGSQIGVVNLADKSDGVVVGVVNLANEFGAFPLGLVNLGADLKPGLDATLDGTGWGSLALRYEGKRFHSRMGGTARLDDPTRRLGVLFGFGAHWELDKKWQLVAEVTARNVFQDRNRGGWCQANWNALSVSAGSKLGPIRVSAGVSYNVLVAGGRGEVEGFVDPFLGGQVSNEDVKLWPGAFVSVGI